METTVFTRPEYAKTLNPGDRFVGWGGTGESRQCLTGEVVAVRPSTVFEGEYLVDLKESKLHSAEQYSKMLEEGKVPA